MLGKHLSGGKKCLLYISNSFDNGSALFSYIPSDNTPISHVNKAVLFRLMIMMMVSIPHSFFNKLTFLYVCALNSFSCFYSV